MTKHPIPPGFHSLTPHLEVRGAARAIDFYKAAFGAREIFRSVGPDGRLIMHAQLQIGDSMLLLHDEFAEGGGESPDTLEGSAVTLHLYVEEADAAFERAVKAGAKVECPIADMFWGDRYGQLVDPFGHRWSIGHKLEELTPADARARREVLPDLIHLTFQENPDDPFPCVRLPARHTARDRPGTRRHPCRRAHAVVQARR